MLKKFLHKFRFFLLGNLREERLSKFFSELIIQYKLSDHLRILDYGSGFHPNVILYISEILHDKGIKAEINCTDFYSTEELTELNNLYQNITFYHLDNFEDKEFDFVIISDVLHHIGIEKKNEIRNLLNKLSQSCNFVLIKDHFEYGPFSRAILRFMDFIGNYKDDVSIPKIYFNEKELNSLMDEIKLIKVKELKNISLYRKIFFPFNLKKFQFIHLYKRQQN